jgi:hypothetical protein
MARFRHALLLAASALLLARGAKAASCANNSVKYCWIGTATGSDFSGVIPLSRDTTSYTPAIDGAACHCANSTVGGVTQYFFADQAALTAAAATSGAVVSSCDTPFCNCRGAGCPISPFVSGTCVPDSVGPLSCRVGTVGAAPLDGDWSDSAPVYPYTASTPGNLVSMLVPAGNICMSTTFGGTTGYYYKPVSTCLTLPGVMGGTYAQTACATNNCGGAPAGTGPFCPSTSAATSCSVGMNGPSAATTALAALLSSYATQSSAAAPASAAVSNGTACLAATATCAGLVAAGLSGFNATTCPTGQNVSVFLAMPIQQVDESWMPTCNPAITTLSFYNFSNFVACGSTNCNSPTAVTYVAASATLGGYTVATFGTKEAGQFAAGMTMALGTPSGWVTVTSVTAATLRRNLLAAGVTVGFSVKTTVATVGAMQASLATPVNATVLQGAGLSALTSLTVVPAPASAVSTAPVTAAALPNTSAAAGGPSGMIAATVALLVASALLA